MLQFRREEALVEAAGKGDVEFVQRALQAGVNPDATSRDGLEAIHAAIYGGHWNVVRLLVDAGAHAADAGDDMSYADSAVARLENAGQHELAKKLKLRGKL